MFFNMFVHKHVFQSEKVFFGHQKKIMVGIAKGPHLGNFDWVRANGSGNGKSRKNYPIIFQINS